MECQNRYRHLPRIHDIIIGLVEKGDTELLQKGDARLFKPGQSADESTTMDQWESLDDWKLNFQVIIICNFMENSKSQTS